MDTRQSGIGHYLEVGGPSRESFLSLVGSITASGGKSYEFQVRELDLHYLNLSTENSTQTWTILERLLSKLKKFKEFGKYEEQVFWKNLELLENSGEWSQNELYESWTWALLKTRPYFEDTECATDSKDFEPWFDGLKALASNSEASPIKISQKLTAILNLNFDKIRSYYIEKDFIIKSRFHHQNSPQFFSYCIFVIYYAQVEVLNGQFSKALALLGDDKKSGFEKLLLGSFPPGCAHCQEYYFFWGFMALFLRALCYELTHELGQALQFYSLLEALAACDRYSEALKLPRIARIFQAVLFRRSLLIYHTELNGHGSVVASKTSSATTQVFSSYEEGLSFRQTQWTCIWKSIIKSLRSFLLFEPLVSTSPQSAQKKFLGLVREFYLHGLSRAFCPDSYENFIRASSSHPRLSRQFDGTIFSPENLYEELLLHSVLDFCSNAHSSQPFYNNTAIVIFGRFGLWELLASCIKAYSELSLSKGFTSDSSKRPPSVLINYREPLFYYLVSFYKYKEALLVAKKLLEINQIFLYQSFHSAKELLQDSKTLCSELALKFDKNSHALSDKSLSNFFLHCYAKFLLVICQRPVEAAQIFKRSSLVSLCGNLATWMTWVGLAYMEASQSVFLPSLQEAYSQAAFNFQSQANTAFQSKDPFTLYCLLRYYFCQKNYERALDFANNILDDLDYKSVLVWYYKIYILYCKQEFSLAYKALGSFLHAFNHHYSIALFILRKLIVEELEDFDSAFGVYTLLFEWISTNYSAGGGGALLSEFPSNDHSLLHMINNPHSSSNNNNGFFSPTTTGKATSLRKSFIGYLESFTQDYPSYRQTFRNPFFKEIEPKFHALSPSLYSLDKVLPYFPFEDNTSHQRSKASFGSVDLGTDYYSNECFTEYFNPKQALNFFSFDLDVPRVYETFQDLLYFPQYRNLNKEERIVYEPEHHAPHPSEEDEILAAGLTSSSRLLHHSQGGSPSKGSSLDLRMLQASRSFHSLLLDSGPSPGSALSPDSNYFVYKKPSSPLLNYLRAFQAANFSSFMSCIWTCVSKDFLNANRIEDAKASLLEALELDETHPLVHSQLGDWFRYLSKWNQAEFHYKFALEAQKTLVEPWIGLAKVYLKLNDRNDTSLDVLFSPNPAHVSTQSTIKSNTLHQYGSAYFLENINETQINLLKARECVNVALKLEPFSSIALKLSGKIYLLEKNFTKSAECFEKTFFEKSFNQTKSIENHLIINSSLLF